MATSIKRCISKLEGLDYSKPSQLFINISSESPIGDGHVPIFTSNRPGSTLEDPLAFVALKAPTNPYISFTGRLIQICNACGKLVIRHSQLAISVILCGELEFNSQTYYHAHLFSSHISTGVGVHLEVLWGWLRVHIWSHCLPLVC
jgi:hypothetical protein